MIVFYVSNDIYKKIIYYSFDRETSDLEAHTLDFSGNVEDDYFINIQSDLDAYTDFYNEDDKNSGGLCKLFNREKIIAQIKKKQNSIEI